ncbi:unnamed protein product, partial [Leptidea sinapis]
LFCPLP